MGKKRRGKGLTLFIRSTVQFMDLRYGKYYIGLGDTVSIPSIPISILPQYQFYWSILCLYNFELFLNYKNNSLQTLKACYYIIHTFITSSRERKKTYVEMNELIN